MHIGVLKTSASRMTWTNPATHSPCIPSQGKLKEEDEDDEDEEEPEVC